MQKTIKIQCPAKINLTLKITGKRPDGFHELDSIMQTINLFDYLTINCEENQNFEINLSGTSNEIPYDKTNLVYKAAKLFFENVCIEKKYKISIYIEKNIPIAAGLAGGSTDAAGTLYGLNKLFEEPLEENDLHKLCSQLGSDLNVCLKGGKLQTSGRGEIINPLQFEEFNLSLIKPINLGISAKEAYTKFSLKNKNDNIRQNYINDLEWAIIDDYKQLQNIKNKYPNSIMSGSGSTYFILNDTFSKEDGYWIKNNLKSIPYGVKDI